MSSFTILSHHLTWISVKSTFPRLCIYSTIQVALILDKALCFFIQCLCDFSITNKLSQYSIVIQLYLICFFNYWWFIIFTGNFTFLCGSVTKPCLTLCNPMKCRIPGLSVPHYLLGLHKLMSIYWVMPSNHLIFTFLRHNYHTLNPNDSLLSASTE